MDNTTHINGITEKIIGCAIKIHNTLGPGLLENVYEQCLFHLLLREGLRVERQTQIPVVFEDLSFDTGFRLDILVEDNIILEIKACESLLPIHTAQIYTYLKLTRKPLGLLMNFNSKLMKDGIKRIAMTHESL